MYQHHISLDISFILILFLYLFLNNMQVAFFKYLNLQKNDYNQRTTVSISIVRVIDYIKKLALYSL